MSLQTLHLARAAEGGVEGSSHVFVSLVEEAIT